MTLENVAADFFSLPHPQAPPSSAHTRRFGGFDSEVLKTEMKADMDFFFYGTVCTNEQ